MSQRSSPADALPDIRRFRATIRRLQQLMRLQLRVCCRSVTLAQCHLLLEVEAQGEATTGRLARELYLDKSTLSRTVDGLVSAGLLRRAAHATDRRITLLSLTPQGRNVCDEINTTNDDFYAQIFRRIPRRHRQAVVRQFANFARAFAEHEDERAQEALESETGATS